MATKKATAKKEDSEFVDTLVEAIVDHYEISFPDDDAEPEEKREAFDLFARNVDTLSRQIGDTATAIVRQKLIA